MSTRTRSSARKQALRNPERIHESSSSEAEVDPDRSSSLEEKEQEIWDEVRDEHYDSSSLSSINWTVSPVKPPLSSDYSDSLLPTIRKYIQLRHKLAQKKTQPHETETDRNFSPQTASPDGKTLTTASAHGLSVPSSNGAQAIEASSASTSTRKMLSHIAWLSEEYLRTSREKVNIAQTAQDSVDRQIRLLDQFIKEQEASLGPEPNAPVMLSMSELAVPKWSRPTRVSMSPMPDEEEEQTAPSAQPTQPEASIPPDRSSKRRPPKNRKIKEKEKEKDDHSTAPPLRITLPPHPDIYVDPNEPTWCYCNRISFGEMIGCDDSECKHEWFHLECVGLKEVPEDDEWYCRECSQRREAKNRRR